MSLNRLLWSSLIGLTFAIWTPAQAQSLSNNEPVGSCPDATAEEAQALGMRQVPIKLPQFVRRDDFIATGLEARLSGHATPDFSRIDDAFKTFSNQLPNIKNKISPKPDKDFLLDFQDDDSKQTDNSIYAFCYSFSAKDWGFSPGVVVSEDGDQLNSDGRSKFTIPSQVYAVFEYDGARVDIASFRYSLTSRFWPLSTVRRIESPNFEVYPKGDDGISSTVGLQLWVAVDPTTVPSQVNIVSY